MLTYRLSQLNGSSYAYDDNGNMTADGRQGLEMEYNVLNLPRRIEDAQTGVGVSYSYLADGTKAEMRRDDGTGLAYAGDMVFTRSANGAYTFESAAYCNGRLLANGTTQKFVTDHLGSVRAVVTGGQVVERNDYYPLGMRHPNPSYAQLTTNRYGYNGKERQAIATSGTYLDYGARFLDPVLGRWTTCDPMAEKYLSLTPYNFCGNDPVNYVDPDGQIFDILWDAANVVMDVQRFSSNVSKGNVAGAIVDGISTVADVAAAVIPFVPGGAGMAVQAARGVDKAVDIAKSSDNIADAARRTDKVSDAIIAGEKAETVSVVSRISNNERYGSYTIEFESGMKYHGKGPRSRMEQSAKEKAKEHHDNVVSKSWSSSPSERAAFMNEALRIRQDGGVGNAFGNYNKINSPGEKMLKKLGY